MRLSLISTKLFSRVDYWVSAWLILLAPYITYQLGRSLVWAVKDREGSMSSEHVYEVRPRKDHHGVDLICDALPFGRLWHYEPTQSATLRPSVKLGH